MRCPLSFRGVVDDCKAAVAHGIDRAHLLFGHVLNGDRQLAGEAGDGERGVDVVVGMADVVVRIDEGQRSLGQSARVLLGNEDAI